MIYTDVHIKLSSSIKIYILPKAILPSTCSRTAVVQLKGEQNSQTQTMTMFTHLLVTEFSHQKHLFRIEDTGLESCCLLEKTTVISQRDLKRACVCPLALPHGKCVLCHTRAEGPGFFQKFAGTGCRC